MKCCSQQVKLHGSFSFRTTGSGPSIPAPGNARTSNKGALSFAYVPFTYVKDSESPISRLMLLGGR